MFGMKKKPVSTMMYFSEIRVGEYFKKLNDVTLYFKSKIDEYQKKETYFNCIKCYTVNEDFLTTLEKQCELD
jgi:hypothetical protein